MTADAEPADSPDVTRRPLFGPSVTPQRIGLVGVGLLIVGLLLTAWFNERWIDWGRISIGLVAGLGLAALQLSLLEVGHRNPEGSRGLRVMAISVSIAVVVAVALLFCVESMTGAVVPPFLTGILVEWDSAHAASGNGWHALPRSARSLPTAVVLCLAVIGLDVLEGSTSFRVPDSWAMYRDNTGYSFRYPPSWHVREWVEEDGFGVFVSNTHPEVSASSVPQSPIAWDFSALPSDFVVLDVGNFGDLLGFLRSFGLVDLAGETILRSVRFADG